MSTSPKAVVLLSGGLDSATACAIARAEGYEVYALSFDYGQRHRHELEAAATVAASLGVREHRVATIDLRAFGGSALTDQIDVPKDRTDEQIGGGIPVTYVPARNTIFLSYALGWAEVLGAGDIVLGVNAVDYSGYPDCRPEYIASYEAMARLATKAGVESTEGLNIRAPLIDWTKVQIIEKGLALGVDFGLTHSCYDPATDGAPCRRCDACHLRQEAFAALGMADPVLERYADAAR